MRNAKDQTRRVVLPVRLSRAEYADLATLAELEQRTRCGMIRRLIVAAARRVSREMRARPEQEAAHGR